MNQLSLIGIARELLAIHEEFPNHLNDWKHNNISDFEMETFVQTWGNTSGGFEGIGGSAITKQRTYVFIPLIAGENYQVYFGGGYAYSVPYGNRLFEEDLKNRQVAGYQRKRKYFEKEKE